MGNPQLARWRNRLLIVAAYGLLLLGGHLVGIWLKENFAFDDAGGGQPSRRLTIGIGVLVYVVLLAIPFVPGIEISLALLAAFGRDIAPLIYGATVLALLVSYLVGRLVPITALARLFHHAGLERAAELAKTLALLSAKERLELLLAAAPRRFVPTLVAYRYIAIIVVLNIPGNAVLGGGGGIALLAGLSGLFSVVPFIAAVAVAVVPIPLATYLIASW